MVEDKVREKYNLSQAQLSCACHRQPRYLSCTLLSQKIN